jgi:hypothetical protein
MCKTGWFLRASFGAWILLALLIVAPVSQAAPFAISGPDAFGYTGAPLAFNFRDISATGTALALGDDAVSPAIGIGFSFSFYGTAYTTAYVSSNGFLTFLSGQGSGCCSGGTIPSAGSPNGLVAGFWEDIDPGDGIGTIRYQTLGAVGSQEFIVGFYGVPHFPSGNAVSFEMILLEGSNNIELQYLSAPSDGGTHTVGIENQAGTDGIQLYRGVSSVDSQQGYLFSAARGGEVPEPSTVGLVAVGLAGVAVIRRRKRA